MTLEQIQEAMKDRNLAYVARSIGMSRQQLWAVVSGKNKNPTVKTLRRIEKYIKGGA